MVDKKKWLKKRIIELAYKKKLTHLGSCLSSVDLIDAIYEIKENEDFFVLSNGHAGLALYVVLEKNGLLKKEETEKLLVHPDRNPKFGIYVSTGSLGQGLPIAVGMALADRSKKVYCLISDGECSEGSIWEAFKIIIDLHINNIIILVNANGWGAYSRINIYALRERIRAFDFEVVNVKGHNPLEIRKTLKTIKTTKPVVVFAITMVEHFPFLTGLDAHYYMLKEDDYLLALEMLK